MRLIDADALTDFLKCLFPDRGMWEIEGDTAKDAICETVVEAMEMVKNMETIKPRPRWIPCSERLPEENLPVLVAVKQKDRLPKWVKEQTHSYVTDIDVYDDGGFFYTHKNNVVAWMPLPEPYREGEQV